MTMTIESAVTTDDLRSGIAPIWHYFGLPPTDEAVASFNELMTPARVLMAADGGAIVGGCGSFPFALATPGGCLNVAGLSMVGVLPTHRRRGILSAMIARFFEDCRARGEAAAYLWASEERIYGRFGFGVTAMSADVDVSRDHAAIRPTSGDATLSTRLVDRSAGLDAVANIYNTVAARTPGAFQRSAEWLRRRTLADPSWARGGGGEKQCLLVEDGGKPVGYALYRIHMNVERGVPLGGLEVVESAAVSPAATVAVWRHLLAMEWTSWTKASFLPVDHPLLLLATEPRRLTVRQRDGAWLRLLDVQTALAAREYGPSEDIAIEIEDALCPWNVGIWRVGAGGVRRTTQAADLRCDIAALACVYLGGFTWRQLVAASRASANDEGAVTRADRVFASRGAPWCPEIF